MIIANIIGIHPRVVTNNKIFLSLTARSRDFIPELSALVVIQQHRFVPLVPFIGLNWDAVNSYWTVAFARDLIGCGL